MKKNDVLEWLEAIILSAAFGVVWYLFAMWWFA